MAPEGLTRDGREAASDSTENQNEDNPFPPDALDPCSPLLGDDRCKFGADTSNRAVRFFLVSDVTAEFTYTIRRFQ